MIEIANTHLVHAAAEEGLLPPGLVFAAVDEIKGRKVLLRHRRWFGEKVGTIERVKGSEPVRGPHTFLLVPVDTPPNGV